MTPGSKIRNRSPRSHGKHTITNARFLVTCPYCMQEFYNSDDVCIDHVYPRSRFKKTKTVVCCKKCNSEKGALTPEEYDLWKALQNAPKEYAVWKQLEEIRNGHLK